jgi:nicotinamide-nucleotide amidase
VTSLANHNSALQIFQLLSDRNWRIVLAESCTAGNVAGSLATIPGVSACLCGSLVVYRNRTKTQWLDIDSRLLDDPAIGPVSSQVTTLLAHSALHKTPEANLAAAVTGHIGPGCPPELDGVVFFSLVARHTTQTLHNSVRLHSEAPVDNQDVQRRTLRLNEATEWVLSEIAKGIQDFNIQDFK